MKNAMRQLTHTQKALLLAAGLIVMPISRHLPAGQDTALVFGGLIAVAAIGLLLFGRAQSFVVEHWRGELSVAESLGVSGLLIGVAVLVSFFTAVSYLPIATEAKGSVFAWVGVPLVLVLTIWQAVGIWRAAGRLGKERRGALWSPLVRALAVTWFVLAGGLAILFARGYFSASDNQPVIACGVRHLALIGNLGYGTPAKVERVLERNIVITTIQLEGGLGNWGTVKDLAALIRQRKLTTYTRFGCIADCAFLFVEGETRVMQKDAKVVFQRPTFGVGRNQLIERGIAPWFVDRIYGLASGEIWQPSHDELLRSGFVTRVVDEGEFPLPRGTVEACG